MTEGNRLEIVCARADYPAVEELIGHLVMLRRGGVIQEIISPSRPCPEGVGTNGFLILVSGALEDDGYAAMRLSHALGEYMQGRAKIFPVWLEAGYTPPLLAGLQQTPRDRPVRSYGNADEGWVAVVNDLRRVFDPSRR